MFRFLIYSGKNLQKESKMPILFNSVRNIRSYRWRLVAYYRNATRKSQGEFRNCGIFCNSWIGRRLSRKSVAANAGHVVSQFRGCPEHGTEYQNTSGENARRIPATRVTARPRTSERASKRIVCPSRFDAPLYVPVYIYPFKRVYVPLRSRHNFSFFRQRKLVKNYVALAKLR